MPGLIERVQEAIRDAEGLMDAAESRAAIAEVAKWLDDGAKDNTDNKIGDMLRFISFALNEELGGYGHRLGTRPPADR